MKTGSLILAARYAKAFDGMAKNTEDAAHNIIMLEESLQGLKSISAYLQNPAINGQVKAGLITKNLPQNTARAFLLILVKEKRFDLIDEILKELHHLLDKRQGIKRAFVTSANILSESTREQLRKGLEEYFKTGLILDFKEDKGLISGIKIKVGDFYIEDSSSSRLLELENVLRE